MWAGQLGLMLAGCWTTTSVSVSGSSLTVANGAGAAFLAGTKFRLAPAGETIWQQLQSPYRGPAYTVTARTGDTLTTSPACPANLPAGTQVVGVGGGRNAVVRNLGHSGYTTPQMLSLVPLAFRRGQNPVTPKLALFGHATNDWNAGGSSTVQSTGTNNGVTDTFTVGAGKGASIAYPGSYLTIGGTAGFLVTAVATDTITAKPPNGTNPANLAAATTVAIDTQNTLIAIGQALIFGGVTGLAVVGQKADNMATGGDWNGSGFTKASWKVSATTYQTNAATALGTALGATVPFIDTYAFMTSRVSGTDAGGSACWEVAATNSHPNAYGSTLMALKAMNDLAANGNIAALQAA
jgi:hypothetical protein